MFGSSNQYVDALATLRSSFVFDEETMSVAVIKKNAPMTKLLLAKKDPKVDAKDRSHPIIEALTTFA